MIYLDNAATTKVTKPVLDAMLPYLTEDYGNPSSVHSMGKKAKQAVEHAREQVATAIGAKPEQIFFTSGATESNNWVGKTILMRSEFEHPSMDNADLIHLLIYYGQPIDGYDTEKQFQDDYRCYWNCKINKYQKNISHIWVNNTTGEIYDIDQWIKRIHTYNGYFHTDATQAFGHVPIDVDEYGIDLLTLSGHKFHTPKGVGILYIRDPELMIDWCNLGGGQEKGYRSGTENVASIVAMGKAAELYDYSERECMRQWNMKCNMMNYIEENIPDYQFVIPLETKQVANILAVAFKDVYGGDLVELMSLKGVCISSGSACSSNSKHNTYYPTLPTEMQDNVIRISMSVETTNDEVMQAVRTLEQCVKQIRGK